MLRELVELYRYHDRFVELQARHDYENVFSKSLRDLREFGLDSIRGRAVLDLGCGQRAPFAILAAQHGADVTALDAEYVKPGGMLKTFIASLWHGGVKRAIKTCARRVIFDGRYYRVLRELSQYERGRINAIKFVSCDPRRGMYPLPDSSFDVVFSNAVVEHVADVDQFASEVSRMLRCGGLFHGLIHNYYSLSGGHNMEWAYPHLAGSQKVPPWDHLRANKFPSHVYLNKLSPQQYLESFGRVMQVLVFEPRDHKHDYGGLEGEAYLTQQVERELRAYPRELLLTRAWCIVCRNRK